MTAYRIALLPGDGIGPEVTAAARDVLATTARRFGHDFAFAEAAIGGAAIDATGDPLPPATLEACRSADAIFLGAIGGPKWDAAPRRPEQGLLALRAALGVYANLRPLRVDEATIAHSPLRPEIARGADFLIVRELTGGLYFGERRRSEDSASDLCTYSVAEIERVARVAFAAARRRRGRLTSVDKANVLETSRLWRETVTRLHQIEFADVVLAHGLVDSTAMHLVTRPRDFDVILTENLFGDILSDEASVLGGSIGLLGSASLGDGGPGLFEPIHGSAPDIAGKGIANPVGAIRSAAMLLDYGLGLNDEAAAVERAVMTVLENGRLTPDLGGDARGEEVAAAVAAALEA